MSVFLFDYPGSFAYRVQRSANGVIRCRYYSCNIKQRKGGYRRASPAEMERIRAWAEKYDAKLAAWQCAEQRKALGEMMPSRKNNTGVRGIRYGKEIQNKRGRRYEWPAFIVCCADLEGNPVTRAFTLAAHGYEGAWTRAVEHLGGVKGLSIAEVETLKRRMPNPLTRLTLALIGGDSWARHSVNAPVSDPFAECDAA